MTMILNIAKDVARNIQETDSLELILTTGSAIQKMFINDKSLEEKGLYLVKFLDNGQLDCYTLLK